MKEVGASLSEQVKEELSLEESEEAEDALNKGKYGKKRTKKGLIFKISLFILLLLLGVTLFLRYTPAGRRIVTWIATEYIYSKLDYQDAEDQLKDPEGKEQKTPDGKKEKPAPDETLVVGEITDNINIAKMSAAYKNAKYEKGVHNILLVGVESLFQGKGRTDSIMIATINTKLKTIGLTSIMRDTYVPIPGFDTNRINTAFAKGGVKLLYETIAENFGIRVDGSVIVDFKAFQKIIDDLGGVEIELTEAEATYLNTTNYISKKKNRNVKPGKNIMNGNQALGYARVRSRPSIDGAHYDMGRTSRHRRVMTAVFDKFKKSDPIKIIKMMNTVLPLVKTDVKKHNAKSYLAELLELTLADVPLDTYRVPADNVLQRKIIGKLDVVISTDWEKTGKELADFLFSPHVKEEKNKNNSGKKTQK